MSLEQAVLDYVAGLENEKKGKEARARIVSHLKSINPAFWQSCEHCGSDFLSQGDTICDFCKDELPGYFTEE